MLTRVLLITMFFAVTLSAVTPTSENVTKLYIATFKRAPDATGLNYWVNESGLNLEDIAQSFFDQSETQELYPSSVSTSSFITSVYSNLFNRSPDIEGFNYWLSELDNGIIIRSVFIQAVINGALNSDAEIMNNKTEVGLYFINKGNSDLSEASFVIADVTENNSTVTAALSYIDTIGSIVETDVNSNVAKVPHNKSSIPMLGILVSYNNVSFHSSDTVWSSKLFGNNEHELNNYYTEVSNSKFHIEKAVENSGIINDGIISVKLNKNHPNLAIDDPLYSEIVYQDLKNAMQTLDSYIDFSNYDSDANGFITPDELLLTFIMAGYEDSYEGMHVNNGTWGHKSCALISQSPTLDGVTLMKCLKRGNFVIIGERHDVSSPHDATIGIIAHELAHSAFLLPDLYNTSGSKGGIGNFGLMGGGTWGTQSFHEYAGNTPVHFSAWSKLYLGWITPIEGSGSESLHESSSPNFNVIKISINSDEYYLLENRNNSGYDKGLFTLDGVFNGGMALWHIDKKKLTSTYFGDNSVNNLTNDKGVDLVEAANAEIDTVSSSIGDEKALFYSTNVNSFETKISNISDRGSTMTLNIK